MNPPLSIQKRAEEARKRIEKGGEHSEETDNETQWWEKEIDTER